ncbi:uncharacterized protein V6R79_011911 [Siganus canaliculatus]
MESVLVGLILVALSGFWCEQPVAALTTPTVQMKVGEEANLQCPLLDASITTTNITTVYITTANITINVTLLTLSWYRKTAEHGPEMLLSFRVANSSHVKYGIGISPQKVSAKADGSLLLHSLQHNDSAVYYCGISQGDGQKDNKVTLK